MQKRLPNKNQFFKGESMKLLLKIFQTMEKKRSDFFRALNEKSRNAKTKIAGKLLIVFGVSQSLVFGKNIEKVLEDIFSFLEGGIAKSIAGIIFVGLGIYVLRNLERWKEILLNVIATIVAITLILNARTIAGMFF